MTDALSRAADGMRLTPDEGLALFAAPLLELGLAADARCRALHPGETRTYVIGRNINYTNICTACCTFCAFYRGAKSREGYLLSIDDILGKVAEMAAVGGTEMLLQGGLHPALPLSWFAEVFRAIAEAYPRVQVHALSPPEILRLAEREAMSIPAVLARLRAAGLASIPGGGAEILVDRVRARISPRKYSADQWLGVMREAHRQGLPTTATMMYGHVETLAERIAHLERLRALQEETGGFVGFIPWPFQPGATPLARDGDRGGDGGGAGFLRMLAISRLYLDNIPHLQSSWVTQGMKIGQLGLCFGADDLGSTMMEEQVVSAAGTTYRTNADTLRRLIDDLGFRPAQRTTTYRLVGSA
ncbi:MAG TPA: cyclic dehypoxanthinyl futalosine synthase [Armatimonadota bacterium]|nr:cyclic dehypoxanthinyl futalosine synthase [Armatimonadota bacterium]